MPSEDISNILIPPQKRSLADDIVDRLREAIFSGQLAPNERLREETLAEFLRVSRGPIREALGQLEREGLVIKEPNRGARVARVSRHKKPHGWTSSSTKCCTRPASTSVSIISGPCCVRRSTSFC